MNRIILVLFSFFIIGFVNAQVKPPVRKFDVSKQKLQPNDTLGSGSNKSTTNKGLKNDKAKIEMYKIISIDNDTTFVDTTLTLIIRRTLT